MDKSEYASLRTFEEHLERVETAAYIAGADIDAWRAFDPVVPALYDLLLAEIAQTKPMLKTAARAAARVQRGPDSGKPAAVAAYGEVMARLTRKLFRMARLNVALDREHAAFDGDQKALVTVEGDVTTIGIRAPEPKVTKPSKKRK